MEERHTDINTTIGFMLIGVILMFWIYTTPPPAQLESIDEDTNELIEEKTNSITKEKSLSLDGMTDQLFNKDAIDGLENRIEIKNELYSIEFSENGGQISQLALNKYVDHNGSPIYLINNGNLNKKIIIYGKNYTDYSMYKKYEQIKELGFTNVLDILQSVDNNNNNQKYINK